MPWVVSASSVMWVKAPPPDTSLGPPSAQRTRLRSYRDVPGVRYASMPMIGFTPAFFAFSWNSQAAWRFPWSVIASAGCSNS
jgi:hypothetical protein